MKMLEICAADLSSVQAAALGGAQRVELCSGLGEGGLTPSAGLIREALRVADLRVHVLIRPRQGDFLYSPTEVEAMAYDIGLARQLGAHGVVIGALTPEGDVDQMVMRRLMAEAEGLSVTFHRAFDLCRDPKQALEDIVALGCHRILSSGQAPTALQGADMLHALTQQARGRITMMAGCGLTADNAAEILQKSGVDELHGTLREAVGSRMTYRNCAASMSADADEYQRLITSPVLVRRVADILQQS